MIIWIPLVHLKFLTFYFVFKFLYDCQQLTDQSSTKIFQIISNLRCWIGAHTTVCDCSALRFFSSSSLQHTQLNGESPPGQSWCAVLFPNKDFYKDLFNFYVIDILWWRILDNNYFTVTFLRRSNKCFYLKIKTQRTMNH